MMRRSSFLFQGIDKQPVSEDISEQPDAPQSQKSSDDIDSEDHSVACV
jgi:hypothetical protein